MGEDKNSGDLQLQSDLAHERREWRVQRFGWVLLALFCGSALAGLLGPGPLSKAHAGKIGSELFIEYHRNIRKHAPSSLKIFCRPNSNREQFSITLDRGFLEKIKIERIQPEPANTVAAGDNYIFRFGSSGNSEQVVTFHFEADSVGQLETTVKLDETTSEKIQQFAWP